MSETANRFIGISHRIKKTAKNEARPTLVVIEVDGKQVIHELDDDTAELDFVRGIFPLAYRQVEKGEDLSGFNPRQLRWKKLDGDKLEEAKAEYEGYLLRQDKKTWYVATHVPTKFEGLQAGDTVTMILGGSGDRLAFSMSRRAETIGATVLRLPGYDLNARRNGASKDDDHITLAQLARQHAELFYPVMLRDRDLIAMSEALYARNEAQQARIGCEQRLRGRFIGRVFLNEEGGYPEGAIEDAFDELKNHGGLGDCRQRSFRAHKRHVTLCLVAYSLLRVLSLTLPQADRIEIEPWWSPAGPPSVTRLRRALAKTLGIPHSLWSHGHPARNRALARAA